MEFLSSQQLVAMPRLVLAAVPEQVNIPILLCLERKIFERYGLEVVHRVVPEGTGKMLDLLESGEVDVALTVTDGFIAGKAGGRRVRLVGTFADSPLVWAVACSGRNEASSSLATLSDLKTGQGLSRKCRVGISRIGSGSHTMGIYMGKKILGEQESLEYVVANNFQGLRDGTHKGDFDVFMWETFTTKPFFDSGELRKVGEVPTPWTAFSFVCSTEGGSERKEQIDKILSDSLFPALQEGVVAFVGDSEREATLDRICNEHGHQRRDAAQWLESCSYAVSTAEGSAIMSLEVTPTKSPFSINRDHTARAMDILKEVGLVPPQLTVDDLLR